MEKVKELAKKWYGVLEFPGESDERFYNLLENTDGLYECDIKTYLEKDSENKEKNAIMFLYFCEELSRQYEERGIDEAVFYESIKYLPDTLVKSDFKVDKDAWIVLSLKFEIFRLGRLQFQMSKMYPEGKDGGFSEDTNIIDVHIPADGGSITSEVIDEAFGLAEEFFSKHFPEYEYKYYTCFSWMLDDNLQEFLGDDTNIIKFQKRFNIIHKREQDSIIHFLFKFGFTDREEIRDIEPKSEFARKIKDKALSGGKFYNVLGYFERK